MENVSITLLVVLALVLLVVLAALVTGAYALRVERRYHALRGTDPEAPRLRAGSSSGDLHVLVRFEEAKAPRELVEAIGGMLDAAGLRGASRDLIAALPDASHAHVSCAHFHDIAPKRPPKDGVHLYVHVRTRTPIALPAGDIDRALLADLLGRFIALEDDAVVEAKAVVVKTSSDPAAARMVELA